VHSEASRRRRISESTIARETSWYCGPEDRISAPPGGLILRGTANFPRPPENWGGRAAGRVGVAAAVNRIRRSPFLGPAAKQRRGGCRARRAGEVLGRGSGDHLTDKPWRSASRGNLDLIQPSSVIEDHIAGVVTAVDGARSGRLDKVAGHHVGPAHIEATAPENTLQAPPSSASMPGTMPRPCPAVVGWAC